MACFGLQGGRKPYDRRYRRRAREGPAAFRVRAQIVTTQVLAEEFLSPASAS